jgi:acyl carrier protein
MKKNEFIIKLKEELELESDINFMTDLKALDEWDSMTAMVLIGFVSDNFGLTLTAEDIKQMTNIDSLVTRIGKEKIN